MNSRDEIVFDGDMRPLPQDPNAPLRGVTEDGQECRCDCHEAPNVYHVSACCRSACHECGSRGILFHGKGRYVRYRICSQWQAAGHPTWDEMQRRYRDILAHSASGRSG